MSILGPHGGGGLVNRIVPEEGRESFFAATSKLQSHMISDADLSVFYRIADGALSPLEGAMDKEEFNLVLEKEYIIRGGRKYAWTIPIAFMISKQESEKFAPGEVIAIKDERDVIIGSLEISDIYYFDKDKYNKLVYGTDRKDHPGPEIVNDDPREYLMGGTIKALPQFKNPEFGQYMLSPEETRELFAKKRWERIVAFQTRNPLHRAHEYAMVYGLETLSKEGAFAGAVLNPLVGQLKSDDVPAEVRMRTYEVLINQKLIGVGDRDEAFWKSKEYDLTDQLMLIGLDMRMYYAGPKEAIMHAIYRQNYGFTDIVIGRKHADAPFDDGTPAWGDFDAQEKFSTLEGELEIKPAKVGFAAYFEELGRVGLIEDNKDNGYKPVSISGKELRRCLEHGEPVDERVMRKPVVEILYDAYQHNIGGLRTKVKSENITWHASQIMKQDRSNKSGHKPAVIWLTGLPSSGKSTISVELQSHLFNKGCNVYILDGDNVRHGLNRDLGFSHEDRKENIRRIGEVAKLFCEAGFLIVTAFISPYREDRDNVRSIMNPGEFLEVFVDTDVSVCEERDPKGLYKKARSGEIKGFTGVSAPYEEPLSPEIVAKTENKTVQESAETIISYLKEKGYLLEK